MDYITVKLSIFFICRKNNFEKHNLQKLWAEVCAKDFTVFIIANQSTILHAHVVLFKEQWKVLIILKEEEIIIVEKQFSVAVLGQDIGCIEWLNLGFSLSHLPTK